MTGIVPAHTLPPKTVVVSLTGPEHDDLRMGMYLLAAGVFAAGAATGWYLRSRRTRRSRRRRA